MSHVDENGDEGADAGSGDGAEAGLPREPSTTMATHTHMPISHSKKRAFIELQRLPSRTLRREGKTTTANNHTQRCG